ncbi:MAG: hypothetical protein F6K35_22430, partial [Okeania sp. SIO2H7]|nr:hypothetical protein [Okeania sp. SIO2H7]
MTQLREDNDRHQPQEELKASATDDREKKTTDLSEFREGGTRILVFIACCASVVALFTGGITIKAAIAAAIGAVAGAIVGLILLWL